MKIRTPQLVHKNVCLVRFVSPIRDENSGGMNIMSSLSSRCRISIGMSAPFSVESALVFLCNLNYCGFFSALSFEIEIIVSQKIFDMAV